MTEQVAVAISDATTETAAQTKNLSAAGAYCTVERFIPPMTKVALRLEIPDGGRSRTIRCAGVVVRADPFIATTERGAYHLAVFFTDLSERDRTAIGRFVQRRLSAGSSTD